MPVTSISWQSNILRIIDQTKLPNELVYLDIADIPTLVEAIMKLRVRGAPAIGVAAAFGVVIGVQDYEDDASKKTFFSLLDSTVQQLRNTRPTAVNLAWALESMREVAQKYHHESISAIKEKLLLKAKKIYTDDQAINRKLAKFGANLIQDNAQIITHCNTGALATVDYGTALGSLFYAHSCGKKMHVWVDETRPLLQGARLNMWELQNEGINCTLICDNTAAFVMQKNHIDLCIVGADRIAANGDTANKIGTYSLAVLAKYHKIPFYVAAPTSTFDPTLTSGNDIPIEERPKEEIIDSFGCRTAPQNSKVYSPAFDVTPHTLISAIITERGVINSPDTHSTLELLKKP
ncbi:MAG: S-methyl-5-thioribose-1-phosphate isomerase [Calditrichaeota bacterium]|nr:MAG: S-methyl-5-thioribose-1-phosphate isomerase [Calditrichota bacterium]